MDHPWFEDISRCFFVWDSFSETKSPKTSLYLCMSSIKSQNFFPLPWPESLHWSRSDLASNEAGWRSMKSTSLSIIILSFHFADCNHSGCHSIMFADLLILSLRLYGWWLVVSSVSLFFSGPIPRILSSWTGGSLCWSHPEERKNSDSNPPPTKSSWRTWDIRTVICGDFGWIGYEDVFKKRGSFLKMLEMVPSEAL